MVQLPTFPQSRDASRSIRLFSQTPTRLAFLLGLIVALGQFLSGTTARAQEAEWIWAPEHEKEAVPANESCFFRRAMALKAPEAGRITIAADDAYELYFNGKKIASVNESNKFQEFDITAQLLAGVNLVAVRATNRNGNTAALVARVLIKEKGGPWFSYSTNDKWKTNLASVPLWNTVASNDQNWKAARSFGRLGETAPWDLKSQEQAAAPKNDEGPTAPSTTAKATPKLTLPADPPETKFSNERFSIDEEFRLERLLDGDAVGSLLAITFTEFGQMIGSLEGGPLVSLYDSNGDGSIDKSKVICEAVESCQGIVAVNGELFVTGKGADGAGLYRLTDTDRNGSFDEVALILSFGEDMSEHGPHGLQLGPDGLLYIVVGNETKFDEDFDPASPYRNTYEGDLVGPRYEDPGGHAVGVKAPGGAILRTDVDGTAVQIVAGGLRNAYDLCFNRDGELFVPDSDMEADEGTPWHRPTRIHHVVPGGEYGWRSGWANWPQYYVDMLPPVASMGRGSPTGCVVYDHYMFPQRYHGTLFVADWANGRIVATKLRQNGATVKGEPQTFLEGNPLNVTDLEVGPDGALYFCTGGRGTTGGLYRVSWRGKVPENITKLGDGLSLASRQPQLQAAYARQAVAIERKNFGDDWGTSLVGIAISGENPVDYRLRALDLMRLFGPEPDSETLIQISKDKSPKIRARVCQALDPSDDESAKNRLIELLSDTDNAVRRAAAETLTRNDQEVPFAAIKPVLASDDRFTSFAGRRLLERQPIANWIDEAMTCDEPAVVNQAALAAVIANPKREVGLQVLQKLADLMDKYLSDKDFVDTIRVMQVALHRTNLPANDLPGLKIKLAEEFPAGDPVVNRELIRVLIYLQEGSIIDRYLEFIDGKAPAEDRLHAAMYLRFLENGWDSDKRLKLLDFFENAQNFKGGTAMTRYIINATRDFAMKLTPEEGRAVLAEGARWPNAALGALFKLPKDLDGETLDLLTKIDRDLNPKQDAAQRLQIGIIAVMARSGDERSTAYLREIWERDPERRQAVSMGLALSPGGENWPYIVRTLGLLEPAAAPGILERLTTVDERPAEAEPYRNLIVLGLRMKEKEAPSAVKLLEHWLGESLGTEEETPAEKLVHWQEWYAEEFPDAPVAELPQVTSNQTWSYEQLHQFLIKAPERKGNVTRGKEAYAKAQCAKCHKAGSQGESIGPDLTTVNKRFSRKEMLESIYFPSHIISDQYKSKTVSLKDGRSLSGILAPAGASQFTLTNAKGERSTIQKAEIEEVETGKLSIMPDGLLNDLNQQEIEDLFAFLAEPATTKSTKTAKKKTGSTKR